MTELLTKSMRRFGVKKTKTQVRKVTGIGNVGVTKSHRQKEALHLSSNEHPSFQVVLHDAKFAITNPKETEWILFKAILFLFTWLCCCQKVACSPPFQHSIKCKWSKLRSRVISTNINSDMKNETNSSGRIMSPNA